MEQFILEIKEFIQANILHSASDFSEDTALKDLGLDSFSIVEIVLFIERRFEVLIPDHLMVPETFKTTRSIAEAVDRSIRS
jgi:acyl carrier protein